MPAFRRHEEQAPQQHRLLWYMLRVGRAIGKQMVLELEWASSQEGPSHSGNLLARAAPN